MARLIFRKLNASTAPVETYIAQTIGQHLKANERVLWLVAGGSAIKVAVFVSKLLPTKYLKNLTVTLTDERFGPNGHSDSNWKQLEAAGFRLPAANLQPVLMGKKLQQTSKEYAKTLEDDLRQADYSLALVGMGADGHIFGIKAGSPSVKTTDFAVGYKWEDYDRITATSGPLEKLNEVVLYAVGREKWPQLRALQKEQEPF